MIVTGNFLALFIYAAGLISPLTPSEGMPRPWELLVFAAGPIALLVASARASRTAVASVVIGVQILGVVVFTGYLLWLQYRTLVNKPLQPTRATQPFGRREAARCGPRG